MSSDFQQTRWLYRLQHARKGSACSEEPGKLSSAPSDPWGHAEEIFEDVRTLEVALREAAANGTGGAEHKVEGRTTTYEFHSLTGDRVTLVDDRGGRATIELLRTSNFATTFVIENACAPPLHQISYYSQVGRLICVTQLYPIL